MEEKKYFLEEKGFDRDGYDTCLRRLHYDDRDVVMYENMLAFLWEYAVQPGCLEDYEGLLEEYSRWNRQMIDKCFYHLPHDLPYANIRRAYESVVQLLLGRLEEGMAQFDAIGETNFQYDGRAPKLLMTKHGKRFVPVSKLFLLYNYHKVLARIDKERAKAFREKYCMRSMTGFCMSSLRYMPTAFFIRFLSAFTKCRGLRRIFTCILRKIRVSRCRSWIFWRERDSIFFSGKKFL